MAVTYADSKLIRAVLEVVHIHLESHRCALGKVRTARESRVISGYFQTADRFRRESYRRIGVVEKVIPKPPAWPLNVEAEASLAIVVNVDGS